MNLAERLVRQAVKGNEEAQRLLLGFVGRIRVTDLSEIEVAVLAEIMAQDKKEDRNF